MRARSAFLAFVTSLCLAGAARADTDAFAAERFLDAHEAETLALIAADLSGPADDAAWREAAALDRVEAADGSEVATALDRAERAESPLQAEDALRTEAAIALDHAEPTDGDLIGTGAAVAAKASDEPTGIVADAEAPLVPQSIGETTGSITAGTAEAVPGEEALLARDASEAASINAEPFGLADHSGP